jgi:hypothetical protein
MQIELNGRFGGMILAVLVMSAPFTLALVAPTAGASCAQQVGSDDPLGTQAPAHTTQQQCTGLGGGCSSAGECCSGGCAGGSCCVTKGNVCDADPVYKDWHCCSGSCGGDGRCS